MKLESESVANLVFLWFLCKSTVFPILTKFGSNTPLGYMGELWLVYFAACLFYPLWDGTSGSRWKQKAEKNSDGILEVTLSERAKDEGREVMLPQLLPSHSLQLLSALQLHHSLASGDGNITQVNPGILDV